MLGMKVRAGNDANVAALGEMWAGGGKGRFQSGYGHPGNRSRRRRDRRWKDCGRRSRSGRGDRTRGYGAGRDRALQLRKPGLSGADGVCHRTGPSGPAVSGKSPKRILCCGGESFPPRQVFDAYAAGDAAAAEIVEEFAGYLGRAMGDYRLCDRSGTVCHRRRGFQSRTAFAGCAGEVLPALRIPRLQRYPPCSGGTWK